MSRKIIITGWDRFILTGLHDGRQFVDLDIYDTEKNSELGNIYVGRVIDIVKNINAAFIEYSDGKKGYYSIADNRKPIFLNKKNTDKMCQGDKVLVRLSKEAVKTKFPVLTSKLEFAGKFAVLTYGDRRICFSGKFIDKDRKESLTRAIKEQYSGDFGFIIRTNANEANDEEILAEMAQLVVQYKNVEKKAFFMVPGSVMYTPPKSYQVYVRDLYRDSVDEIVTDSEQIYYELTCVCDKEKLRLYDDEMLPLIKLYSMESLMESLKREKVWLDSGAYLVIQHTEALSVIDVNTGKCIKGKSDSKVFYKVNVESAIEIARQLRLRNMSGIIVVDFINMNDKELDRELLEELRREVSKDRIKTTVVDMTELGLVEITRKKQKPPVHELHI